ncbi:MAG: hypothetical protein KBT48_10120 [Firmicutes bacterium]|nr:hypothetical protein [Bacillota bacterium]
MKKFAISLLSASLLLSGCAGANATIKKDTAKEVIMTVGSTTITKEKEYNALKAGNIPQEVLQETRKIIYNQEVEVTDKIKKEANKQFESVKEMYGDEDIEEAIKSYGYESVDDYVMDYLVPSVQADKLIDKYIKENWKTIKKENKPTLAHIIPCDDEKNAKKALEDLKNGEEFASVYEKYASDEASISNEQIFVSTKSENLPTRLINTLYKSEPGVIDEVFTNDTESGAYVAVLDGKTLKDVKKDLKSSLQSDSNFSSTVLAYYMKKYNFIIHDQYVFDYFRANNPEYIINHPELAQKEEK